MGQRKKTRYLLIGPVMIWVIFIIAVPFLGAGAIISLAVLPPLGVAIVRTAGLFCILVLAPLAALAEIAPPFVIRAEVSWRNRNSSRLFDGNATWEDVPFLPPVLNRIRSATGKRKRQEKRETAAVNRAKPSTT